MRQHYGLYFHKHGEALGGYVVGTAIVVSLSNDRAMAASVKLLISALGVLRRIRVQTGSL
jgi:hypothetical protein